jgi:hypothetical protein
MNGTLWACATVDGTYVKLAELSDLKLKIDGKDIDTSNVDDLGWGSSITGARSWEVTATNNMILTDTAYGLIIAAVMGGTDIYVKALSSGTPTVAGKGFSGKAGVNSGSLVLAATNAQQKADWTIKGRGALSVVAV